MTLSPAHRRKLVEIVEHKKFLQLEAHYDGWTITLERNGESDSVKYLFGKRLSAAIDAAYAELKGRRRRK